MPITSFPTIPYLQQDLISSGAYPQRTFVKFFGKVTGVDNTYKDIWEGPTASYVFPTTAQQMRVVSTSANDTNSSGTGTRQIIIYYLDASFVEQTTTVNLSGTTPVNTSVSNIFRINRVASSSVGSGGYPAGNISVTNTGNTVTYAYMLAGRNTAQQSIYTVPASKDFYISQWFFSSGSSGGNHFTQGILRATAWNGYSITNSVADTGFLTVDPVSGQDNSTPIVFADPIKIPATTSIKISVVSDAGAANVTCTASITGWTQPNT